MIYLKTLFEYSKSTALEKSVGFFLQPKTSLQTLWTHFCWWFFSPPKRVDFCWSSGGFPSGSREWAPSPIHLTYLKGCTFESPAWNSTNFLFGAYGKCWFSLSIKIRFQWSLRGTPTLYYLFVFKIGSENHLTKHTGMVEPWLLLIDSLHWGTQVVLLLT